jgi:hypothetical protein
MIKKIELQDISNVGLKLQEGNSDIDQLVEFRAHAKPVVGLAISETTECILTSSTDCTVRMFSVF